MSDAETLYSNCLGSRQVSCSGQSVVVAVMSTVMALAATSPLQFVAAL